MHKLPECRAVIFDLDGTLLDSLADLAACTNEVLGACGFCPAPERDFRFFVGEGMRKMIHRAVHAVAPGSLEKDAPLLEEMFQKIHSLYTRRWHINTRPYAGIEPLLAGLKAQGVPLAVLSNKVDAFTVKMTDYFFPGDFFHTVAGQREGVPLKPDPAAALGIAKAMGIAPEHIYFMGDTKTDMSTAKNAGMVPVGATWGFRPKEELIEHGARILLEAPEEFLRFF